MIEVNDIFKDLARLVEEQGEMVDNIQTNISTAATHVETGVDEIKKANEYQQSSRKKLIFIVVRLSLRCDAVCACRLIWFFWVVVVVFVVVVVVVVLIVTRKKS